MQTLEAALSFFLFFVFASSFLIQLDYTKPDYSLYRYQIANDIWRVLYLTDALNYYPLEKGSTEEKMNKIEELTGFCTYIEGIQTTSCRSGPKCSDDKITMQKLWFDFGIPHSVRFTVCVPE